MDINKSSTELCVTIVFSLDLVPAILCHNGLSCEETAKSGFIGFFLASFTTDSHFIILAFCYC